MKLSIFSLFFLLAPFLVQGSKAAAPEDALTHPWTDIIFDMRVNMFGLSQEPTVKDILFVDEALKRAYNDVHEHHGEDFVMVDANCTSADVRKEQPPGQMALLGSLQDTLDAFALGQEAAEDNVAPLQWRRRRRYRRYRRYGYTLNTGFNPDIACRLCAPNLMLGDSAVPSYSAALSDFDAVGKELCSILKKEGNKATFSKVHDCSVMAVNNLDHADFLQASNLEDNLHENDVVQSTLAVTLSNLGCADHDEACNNADLFYAVTSALKIAYDQVNFAKGFQVHEMGPGSFELYRKQQDEAAVSVGLRGHDGNEEQRNTFGTWKVLADIHCRACDTSETPVDLFSEHEGVLGPFADLDKVEEIFCTLIADIVDEDAPLADFAACSLSIEHGMMGLNALEATTA